MSFSKRQVRKDASAARKVAERAKRARLKSEIKAARASRAPALKATRAACAVERVEVRTRCATRLAEVRATVAEIIAKNRAQLARDAEMAKLARDADRFVAGGKPTVSKAVRRAESDDAVRSNIDPYLVPYFDHVRRSIKGSPRMSRTEAFMQLVHDSPEDVSAYLASRFDAGDDADYEAAYAKHRRANPKGEDGHVLIEFGALANADTKRGGFMPIVWVNGRQSGDTFGRGHDEREANRLAKAAASEEASRFRGDWSIVIQPRATKENPGRRTRKANPSGRAPRTAAERQKVKAYRAIHWGEPGKREIVKQLAPDPSGGLVVLGVLEYVEYATHKKGEDPNTVFFHSFEPRAKGPMGQGLPLLCVNPAGGLVIVGGGYVNVPSRGIVG